MAEETKKVSVRPLLHEPLCAYCAECSASHIVTTEAGEYPACAQCQACVLDGLHKCDYLCTHEGDMFFPMPDQPDEYAWVKRREFADLPHEYQKRLRDQVDTDRTVSSDLREDR